MGGPKSNYEQCAIQNLLKLEIELLFASDHGVLGGP